MISIDIERPSLLVVNMDLDWYEAGLDLISVLRQQDATAALPVIVCMPDTLDLRLHQSELATWHCHVLKTPFTVDGLLQMVQAALKAGPACPHE